MTLDVTFNRILQEMPQTTLFQNSFQLVSGQTLLISLETKLVFADWVHPNLAILGKNHVGLMMSGKWWSRSWWPRNRTLTFDSKRGDYRWSSSCSTLWSPTYCQRFCWKSAWNSLDESSHIPCQILKHCLSPWNLWACQSTGSLLSLRLSPKCWVLSQYILIIFSYIKFLFVFSCKQVWL